MVARAAATADEDGATQPAVAFADEDEPLTLAEQPADVLLHVGASLADPIQPQHLTALAGSCWACREALEVAVAELQEERRALRALLIRRNCTLQIVASGSMTNAWWRGTGIDAADARLVARCFMTGQAKLDMLNLSANPMLGDAGCAALTDAWVAGSLPLLQRLHLSGTGMGDAGFRALSRAVARGALPSLERLYLDGNSLGDEGLSSFCAAISDGALSSLKDLDLQNNPQLSDAMALASALAETALPALTDLIIDVRLQSPQLQAACAARSIHGMGDSWWHGALVGDTP